MQIRIVELADRPGVFLFEALILLFYEARGSVRKRIPAARRRFYLVGIFALFSGSAIPNMLFGGLVMNLNAPFRRVFLVCCAFSLVFVPSLYSQQSADSPPDSAAFRAHRNILIALGERQMQADELNEAIETFARLTESYPEDAYIFTRLGMAYLKKEAFDEAEEAFVKAKSLNKNLPDAYVGLGLVYAESPARGVSAYYNFRRAVGEAKRATKIDPTYGPAYRLLGEAYERFQEDHERAVNYYLKYIELVPDNPDGLYYFGLACVQAKDLGKIDQYIAPYLKAHPTEVRLVPLVGQAYLYQERYELALEHFERYLQNLDGRERQLYVDITNVASESELQAYQTTSGPERQAYVQQFWARRDPDILTKINERVIEHYRRVWYARTVFSLNVYPWDERGSVYIRYGEPDFRSRSDKRQFVQSPEVEAVRTRMAVDIYGPQAAFLTFTGPVFPVRSGEQDWDPQDRLSPDEMVESDMQADASDEGGGEVDPSSTTNNDYAGFRGDRGPQFDRDPFSQYDDDNSWDEFKEHRIRLQFGGYAPVTIDHEPVTVPWETWTYTQIEGGIEITFTDEMGNGRFDFAPLPPAVVQDADAIQYISRMTEHAPEVIMQRAVSATPDYYRPGSYRPALNFYYDLADFRGAGGQTAVEIYYGIPPEQVEAEQAGDSTYIHVQCALALADEGHTTIYRTAEEFLYRGGVESFSKVKGAFVPELLKTQVPPGKYELQVQLKDMISGRTGLYKQSLLVKDYQPEQLQVSDIQLASAIDEFRADSKFQKGDIWIIPMPTRTYGETQKVYAYFEIYNLKKDEFGQTRYKAQYRVRSSSMPSIGVFGAVASGMRSLFKSRKPQVSVTYEQTGTSPSEHEYVEIDLSKAKRGVNALEVTILDLVSEESVEREVRFRYGQ